MQPDIKKYLYDVLGAIDDLESFIKGNDFNELVSNRLLQAAVEREFEILWDAATEKISILKEDVQKLLL